MANVNANPPPVSLGTGKAWAAGIGTVVSGAVATILARMIDAKWPGFLDATTDAAFRIVVMAIVTTIATYMTPHDAVGG